MDKKEMQRGKLERLGIFWFVTGSAFLFGAIISVLYTLGSAFIFEGKSLDWVGTGPFFSRLGVSFLVCFGVGVIDAVLTWNRKMKK